MPITLTGYDAIDYAKRHRLTLAKYADPTEDARTGLTPDEARAVAAEDPSLVYVVGQQYTAGICARPGRESWASGGSVDILAPDVDEARRIADEWADGGDYPVPPPVTVTLYLHDATGEVACWQHRVPDTACSGTEDA